MQNNLRRGVTRTDVVVVVLILLLLAALLLPGIQTTHTPHRINWCKTNINNVATALYAFSIDFDYYPGYMYFLETDSGKAYRDAQGNPVPVSWVVQILPYLDRKQQYDNMTRDPDDLSEPKTRPFDPRVYVELFVCPSNAREKAGAPMSYVANTGMPDLPAVVSLDGAPNVSEGYARDWTANGMFFDNFSEHPQVKPGGFPNLMVTMRPSMIKDPPNMTILLTENVDATSYIFEKSAGPDPWGHLEAVAGCVWEPGAIDGSTKPPTMTPPKPSLAINAEAGRGNGFDRAFARPSSKHPGGVMIAFAAKNVEFVKDNLSYFVYAKLMASDDKQAKLPGTQTLVDQAFREYPITEASLHAN